MQKNFIKFMLLYLLAFSYQLHAACCTGKVDLGATYVEVDFLKSNHTEQTDCMSGIKGDATIQIYRGIVLKPGFIWAKGGHHGELASGTIGLGHYTPVYKGLALIPSAGVTFSYLKTNIDLKIEEFNLLIENQKERFRSVSPYVGLELCYTFLQRWTFMAGYQYLWSKTHTKISQFVSDKSDCSGSNYTLGIEYSLDKHFSINFGGGYNISLSKEKHGVRGKGLKLGIAYYF